MIGQSSRGRPVLEAENLFAAGHRLAEQLVSLAWHWDSPHSVIEGKRSSPLRLDLKAGY